ncbi:MAG: hypothetical protein K9L62_02210 [Vallitaleaceae bacterium]|nr:hypothetical protein [Vallitaleaceae bacterium]
MASQLELQTFLEDLIGSRNVYFQPPESKNINYPALIYNIDDRPTYFANDKPYMIRHRYKVIVIDRNPNSAIPDKVGSLQSCKFVTAYTKDNLHHTVYNLYF